MVQPDNFGDAADQIAADLVILLESKQHDYGHSNITDFGEYGILVRANDKMARLKNLISPSGETQPSNETTEDSWKDLANYSIIALMFRRGWFELPLQEDKR